MRRVLLSESRFSTCGVDARRSCTLALRPPHTHAKEAPAMDEFERLLALNRPALERFVRYRVPGRADADDVIQETLIAAYRAFDSLRDPASFKPWLMSIARNKARDWFRNRARELALPLDALSERVLTDGRLGPGLCHRRLRHARAPGRPRPADTLPLLLPQPAAGRHRAAAGHTARHRQEPPAHRPAQLPRRVSARPGWTRKELSIWINRQSNCPSCCPTTA